MNDNKPLVSIVTPSYNQGQFIRETIDSVLGQDYPNIEHIVVDGDSSDDTVDVLKSYGDRIRCVSEPDNGQTDAINKGIAMASGDIISYLNSDDMLLDGTISRIVDEFEKSPETDFLYGDHHAIDVDSRIIDRIKTIPFHRDVLLYDANFICQPASFYRRRLFDRIGVFNDELHYLMDYEFFLRAAFNDVRMKLVPEYLSAIRYHGDCKTLTGSEPWAAERRELKARYARPWLFTPTRMKIASLVFRLKRYLLLILRGRLDFMNLALALKQRSIGSG